MLLGAIGCNLAWGIIDAAFYLISCLTEHGRNATILRSVQRATDPTHAQRIIADALPAPVATALQPTDFERVREHLSRLPAPTDRPRLTAANWRGAVMVFLLVFLSTFPVVIPFLFMQDARLALRVSNYRRHRDALRSRLPARQLCRHAPHPHRPRDRRHRRSAGGTHDYPRRLIFPAHG